MTGSGLQRILIAGDTVDQGLERAYRKALRLCGGDPGARIEVLCPVYDAVAEEPAEVLSAAQRQRLVDAALHAAREDLGRLIRTPPPEAASVTGTAVWQKDAAAAIVGAATRLHARLLIKPMSEHHGIGDFFRTPLDWALMRQAPCAVLLSTADWGTRPGDVLAAVDAGDEAHAALSREVLRRAFQIAATLGVRLQVAAAYPDLGQDIGELQVADDFAGIKADMREARRRALAGMLAELEIEAAEVHIVEGKPGKVLPALAQRLEPVAMVLGTAARRGVAKLVVGNTAEDLVGRTGGDLMTVREPWS